jgi:hypothetical protein
MGGKSAPEMGGRFFRGRERGVIFGGNGFEEK